MSGTDFKHALQKFPNHHINNSPHKNRFTILFFILVFCFIALGGCASDQGVTPVRESGPIRYPTGVQLALDLPNALTETTPQAISAQAASQVNFVGSVFGNSNIISNSEFVFDPFLGQGNSSATQADCPGVGPEEPSGIAPNGAYQGLCFARAIQLSLKRMVSDYANTKTIIGSVASQLSGVQENRVIQYYNPNIETSGGTGLIISFKYYCVLNCSNPDPDQRDYTYELGLANASDPTTPIGHMKWTVKADGSTSGTMVVAQGLMSLATGWRNTFNIQNTDAPTQIQYTFSSDSSGSLKEFTMKYANNGGDEFLHDANVVRIERRPATATEPALWIVQGTIVYKLGLGVNPARGPTWHPQVGNIETKLHFNAVAEDITEGGRALFNAVLADDTANALVRSTALSPVSLQDSHLWAAYKKLLQTIYTEANYRSWGLGTQRSILIWDSASNSQASLPLFSGIRPLDFDLSADGRRLVTGSEDGWMRIYDTDADSTAFGTELLSCQPHGGVAVYTVRFSNDGSEVLTSGGDHQVRRISSADCSVVAEITHPADAACGPSAYNGYYSSMRAVYFPDGSAVATVQATRNGAMVRHWTLSGTLIRETRQEHIGVAEGYIDPGALSYQCARMHSIEVDPSGGSILTGYEDQTARVWDLAGDAELILRHGSADPTAGYLGAGIFALFNPDGTEIITASNGDGSGIYRWEIPSLSPGTSVVVNIPKYQESTYPSNVLSYSPDASLLFAGHLNRMSVYTVTSHTAQAGSVLTPTSIAYQYPANVRGLRAEFLPGYDNSVVFTINPGFGATGAVTAYNALELWNNQPATTMPFIGHQGNVSWVSFSSDGKRLVSAGSDGTVRIWASRYGALIKTLLGHGPDPLNSSLTLVNSAVFVDGDTKVLSAGVDGNAILWDVASGTELRRFPHASDSRIAVANGNFTQIATAEENGNITLWDPQDNSAPLATLASAHIGGATSLVFSPDDTMMVSAGEDGVVRFWDVTVTPPTSIGSYNAGVRLYSLDYAPDGSRVAVGSGDGLARIIGGNPADTATFAQLITSVAHAGNVTSVRFSRHDNGMQLLTTRDFFQSGGSVYSHEVRHFDVDSNSTSYGQLLMSHTDGYYPQNRNTVTSGTFSPDGAFVAAGYPGGRFDPSWVDFDGVWATYGWADETDVYNPYFLEPIVSNSASDCFQLSTITPSSVAPSCRVTCADVANGCFVYKLKSAFRHNREPAASPVIDPQNYVGLSTALDDLTNSNSWYIDNFTPISVPQVQ